MNNVTVEQSTATDRAALVGDEHVLVTPKKLPLLGITFHLNHLRRMWNADPPRFPKPLLLSEYRIGWRLSDLKAWMDNRPTVEPRQPTPRRNKTARR